jgi:hypothetical protein
MSGGRSLLCCGLRLMVTFTFGPVAAAQSQSMVNIAAAENGDELFVDRSSLKNMPPLSEFRRFPATQIWATNIVAATRRVPARSERFLFSFNCALRTSLILSYRNNRTGTKLQDWQAADLDYKYEAPRPGSLADFSMLYACSGGRLPVVPKSATETERVDEDIDSTPP